MTARYTADIDRRDEFPLRTDWWIVVVSFDARAKLQLK
jgi:hypothetical protein